MLKKSKHFIIGFLFGAILFISLPVFADIQEIQVFYNNIKISLDNTMIELKDVTGKTVEPFIYNGTTYLPVRAIAETLGLEVSYNNTSNTVELKTTQNLASLNSIEQSPTQQSNEFQQWVLDNTDKDGNVVINGKKVNVYTGLEVGTEVINKSSTPPQNTTSDGVKITRLNENGEYSKEGKVYVNTYDIFIKYKDIFYKAGEPGVGFRFSIVYIDDTHFKLVLYKNNVIVLDNIPTFSDYGYDKIPLDYYEEHILPLFK